MNRTVNALFVPLVLSSIASPASAATITYTLDLSIPGNFTLTAATSAGDNAGLMLFSVPLLGNVLTADIRAPYAVNINDFQPAGFVDFRSADISSSTLNPQVTGAQYLLLPSDKLIRGFGQQPGSFSNLGPLLYPDPSSDDPWQSPLVLARGTYSGSLDFNRSHVDLVGNVIVETPNGPRFPQAQIQLVVVPEPALVSILAVAICCPASFVRRRAASLPA